MKGFKQFILTEANLSRFYKHIEDCCPVVVVSACRSELSNSQNLNRTLQLKDILTYSGFSYNKARGGFVETLANGETRDVDGEYSFIVYGDKVNEKQLRTFGFMMGKQFNQDAIMVIDSNKKCYWLVTTSYYDQSIKRARRVGEKIDCGTFHPTKLGKYYTKIGKKHFVFTNVEPVVEHQIKKTVFEKMREDQTIASVLKESETFEF